MGKLDYNQYVPGEGPDKCDIVFVAQNPGKRECETGRLLTGPSGKEHDTSLASVGLKRRDTYTTNVYKFHKPKDKDPTPAEIAEVRDGLIEEVLSREPKFIVTMGNIATNIFVPGTQIGYVHEKQTPRGYSFGTQ